VITADGGAYRKIEEASTMGMIAFYAGLFIGILLGFFLSSLLAFSLATYKVKALPDLPAEFSQGNSLET
jgi:hypothetical protein